MQMEAECALEENVSLSSEAGVDCYEKGLVQQGKIKKGVVFF